MLPGQVLFAVLGKCTGEIHLFLHTPSQCKDSLIPFFLTAPESEPHSPLRTSELTWVSQCSFYVNSEEQNPSVIGTGLWRLLSTDQYAHC